MAWIVVDNARHYVVASHRYPAPVPRDSALRRASLEITRYDPREAEGVLLVEDADSPGMVWGYEIVRSSSHWRVEAVTRRVQASYRYATERCTSIDPDDTAKSAALMDAYRHSVIEPRETLREQNSEARKRQAEERAQRVQARMAGPVCDRCGITLTTPDNWWPSYKARGMCRCKSCARPKARA